MTPQQSPDLLDLALTGLRRYPFPLLLVVGWLLSRGAQRIGSALDAIAACAIVAQMVVGAVPLEVAYRWRRRQRVRRDGDE